MMNTTKHEQALRNSRTMEELNRALKQAIIAFHPDNNIDCMAEATEAFLYLRQVYDNMRLRITGYKPSKQLEREVQKRAQILKIRRNIESAEEFFSMSGEEQLSVLNGMSAHVAIVLNGMIPAPNNKQITDKHCADRTGNFDGIRSYAFVQYVFNKNHTINIERLAETAQTAWIKLAENCANEKYADMPFYALLWTSCRQAMNNLYKAEIKHDRYIDRNNKLDLNAYESKTPAEGITEANALYRVWIDSFFTDKTDQAIYRMKQAGYTDIEIGEELEISHVAVVKRLRKIHDRMNEDRMLQALNMTREKAGCRKNASAGDVVRALIMQAIRSGMSYKRIAYYLHCEVNDISKLLVK